MCCILHSIPILHTQISSGRCRQPAEILHMCENLVPISHTYEVLVPIPNTSEIINLSLSTTLDPKIYRN